MSKEKEICVECGRSVAWGSGRFVNRVPVGDKFEVRKEVYPYPEGEWICAECEEKTNSIDVITNLSEDEQERLKEYLIEQNPNRKNYTEDDWKVAFEEWAQSEIELALMNLYN